MRAWLVPPRRAVRATEATPEVIAATGASGGGGYDPVDKEYGWRRAGSGAREVPEWTREQAVQNSIASYRSNPMARAIVDTYTSFVAGDVGISYQCTNDDVERVVREFWHDPRNDVAASQDIALRSAILTGERAVELLTGKATGVMRLGPIATPSIIEVRNLHGNPSWPDRLVYRDAAGNERTWTVAAVSDESGLREGEVLWWTPWRSLETDTRSMPFLTPVLDWLDSYDQVLSNLIDRTALARHVVFDVTVEGDQTDVDEYVASRGGSHVPASGTVEVHNADVTWATINAQSGAFEDTSTAGNVLTLVASGTGLAKTWLADPDGANRATSMTMAEPIRRRVQGVQGAWLAHQTEQVRNAVDRAVAAGRLPRTVKARDSRTGQEYDIPAAETVQCTGPEIAAADSQYQASVLLNLSTGLQQLVESGALSPAAARVAARKAWEDYVGVTYSAELDDPERQPDDVATYLDEDEVKVRRQMAAEKRKAAVPVSPVAAK